MSAGSPSTSPGPPLDVVRPDSLLAYVSDVVIATDMQGNIVFWNSAAERLYGRSAAEAYGQSLENLFGSPPLSPDAQNAARLELLQSGEWRGDASHRDAHGGSIPVHVAVNLLRDQQGEPAAMVAIVRDVRDRHAAERDLRESEERFRATFEQAAVGLAHTGLDGRLIRLNDRFCEITGYSREELIGVPVETLIHPDEIPLDRSVRASLLSGERATSRLEKRYLRNGGAEIWVAATLSLKRREDGTAEYFIGVIEDITERKAYEAEREAHRRREQAAAIALKAQEARFRSLFEGTSDAVIVFNVDERCMDANPAALDLLGYTKPELLQLSKQDLAGPESAWFGDDLDHDNEEGRWEGEIDVRAKDGRMIPVQSLSRAMQTDVGPIYWSILRDLTEQRAREEFEQNFLNDIAHDLKNPLAAAKAQLQLLQRRTSRGRSDPETTTETLVQAQKSIDRMSKRLDELADIARLRSNAEIELVLVHADLMEIARQSADAYRQTTERHPITVDGPETALYGTFDRDRIMRVLDNLFSNAIKYSPAGGPINVNVERARDERGEWAVISVTDSGVGIPESDLPIVFERFRRAANVARIAGTGIGLAGARRIVETHGGTMCVASTEGKGSTFTIRLPLTQAV